MKAAVASLSLLALLGAASAGPSSKCLIRSDVSRWSRR